MCTPKRNASRFRPVLAMIAFDVSLLASDCAFPCQFELSGNPPTFVFPSRSVLRTVLGIAEVKVLIRRRYGFCNNLRVFNILKRSTPTRFRQFVFSDLRASTILSQTEIASRKSKGVMKA
jgi:hypothetical protein